MTPAPETSAPRASGSNPEPWQLRLYVAGLTPRSLAAFVNLKRICEEHLAGRYRIEVVDLLDDPRRAAADQVLALPTVIRQRPGPPRRVVGDLSNTRIAMHGLQIREAESA